MKKEVLERIGFTKNESLVYLSLLKLGTSKTGEILKSSGLNSGKIYEILESLKSKGLVSENLQNNVRHFSASPPSQILTYLDHKKSQISEDEKAVHSILPNLEKLYKGSSNTSKSASYHGLKGIKIAIDEALSSLSKNDEVLSMGLSKSHDKVNKLRTSFSKKRVDSKIPSRMIFTERSDHLNDFQDLKHTQVRILTSVNPVSVDIFGDKVLIHNFDNPSCVLIHDSNTASSLNNCGILLTGFSLVLLHHLALVF